MQYLIAVFIIA